MADPKYVNLRGIAYDQPDCYETSDLPEADQNREEIEEDSEFIEKLHINVPDSFSKFKGKTLVADAVDFSDRLRRGRTVGYYARSGDWELAGAGEKETPLQRYERLKLEFKELTEDIGSIKEGEGGAGQEPKIILAHVSQMLQQLESLKLEHLPESESVDLRDPQGIHMRKLLNELKREASSKSASSEESSKPGEGRVIYSVLARPDHASAQIAARIARLEQQIHDIQSILSPSQSKTSQVLGDRCLLDLAREVESQVSMLVPSQLDAVDSRISSLLAKMDKVQEKTPSQTAEADSNKVNELYDLLKGSGEVSDVLLPQAVERLVTLESLHKQALDFSKSKADYEVMQSTLKNDFGTTKKLLDKMEESLDKNMQTLKTTVEKLDSKIKTLTSTPAKGKKK